MALAALGEKWWGDQRATGAGDYSMGGAAREPVHGPAVTQFDAYTVHVQTPGGVIGGTACTVQYGAYTQAMVQCRWAASRAAAQGQPA